MMCHGLGVVVPKQGFVRRGSIYLKVICLLLLKLPLRTVSVRCLPNAAWKAVTRKLRELGSIGSAVLSTGHPYMAHIVPMRRCNLACTYCNEYDDFSDPVPMDEMLRRIDHLGRLGTSVITISGGEPLLHPELDQIIARIRKTGAIAGMITNGYLLMPDRIKRLNAAGLDHMQISIDNVMPDEVSKKSLKVLDAKLRMLAEHADFHVNINSVVGGGIAESDRCADGE